MFLYGNDSFCERALVVDGEVLFCKVGNNAALRIEIWYLVLGQALIPNGSLELAVVQSPSQLAGRNDVGVEDVGNDAILRLDPPVVAGSRFGTYEVGHKVATLVNL